jgi:ATP-dependent DNA helicase RecQ
MNFLQIPNGLGGGNYYDFPLAEFIQKFHLPAHLVINTLKVLEHENLFTFNEQIFLSSRIMFTCDKEMLYDFEASHPTVEPVIKALLRSYEGVFDQEVGINEKSLAFLLRMEVPALIQYLQKLQSFGILNYTFQKDTPQLYFIQNRVKAEDLQIDMQQYNKRKKLYTERVESFIDYIQSDACRSQLTGNYFGDENMKPCGICDNCLNKRQWTISEDEFSQIEKRILTAISAPIHARDLVQHLAGIKKEKVWKVIAFLQAENRIEVNKSGLVTKTG